MQIQKLSQVLFSNPSGKTIKIFRAVAIALILGYAFFSQLSPMTGYDWYNAFLKFGQNPFKDTYLSWLFLVFGPITKLPHPFAWFTALNALLLIASLFFIENPSPWLVLNLPILWIFFYGQIDAWVVFGAIFGQWAIKKKHPYWLGLALLALFAKPHIGIILCLFYFLQMRNLKSLVIPGAVAAVSFIFYGFWPIVFIQNYLAGGSPVYNFFVKQEVNTSLWPWALIVLPVILWKWKKLSFEHRGVVLLAASCLIFPYSPFYSAATLIFLTSSFQLPLVLLIPAWFSKPLASISGMVFYISSLILYLFFPNVVALGTKKIDMLNEGARQGITQDNPYA